MQYLANTLHSLCEVINHLAGSSGADAVETDDLLLPVLLISSGAIRRVIAQTSGSLQTPSCYTKTCVNKVSLQK